MLRRLLLATTLAFGVATAAAQANTFRWANDGDVNSLDPYTRQETFLLTFNANIYEPLIRRDRNLGLEPALATSWEQVNPTTWRFKLREGVKFSDGSPLTAEDVLFSIARARGPGSNVGSFFASVADVRKVDDLTVEMVTAQPDPILPNNLTSFGVMSKAWLERNNASRVADLTSREENFATRNAMGTGPFMLSSREPDRRTVWCRTPTGGTRRRTT
jgi:peptide/nickel transport system substrate-binding protein